jgi:hypothetical protein
MLTGLPPFYDTNVQRMYHKILHDPLKFPRAEGYVEMYVCMYLYHLCVMDCVSGAVTHMVYPQHYCSQCQYKLMYLCRGLIRLG